MSIEISALEMVERSVQLRDEWIADVDSLYREAESWAKAQGWTTRRRWASIEESKFGCYSIGRLLVESPVGRLDFRPVARFVIGGFGLIDLVTPPSRQPSRMMVRQGDGKWLIHPFGDSEISTLWSEMSFTEVVRSGRDGSRETSSVGGRTWKQHS